MKSKVETQMKLTDLKILLEKEEKQAKPNKETLLILNTRIETLSWVLL